MSNFDCLSCERGDKCTAYMATGITRCNDYGEPAWWDLDEVASNAEAKRRNYGYL